MPAHFFCRVQSLISPKVESVMYEQGRTKLKLVNGVAYMAQLMTNPSLPTQIRGPICFSWLPSYVFPANAKHHNEIIESNFVVVHNAVLARVKVRYGEETNTYHIALIHLDEFYGLTVTHKALTADSITPAIENIIPAITALPFTQEPQSLTQVQPAETGVSSLISPFLQPLDLGKEAIFITVIPTETFQAVTSLDRPVALYKNSYLQLDQFPSLPEETVVIIENQDDQNEEGATGCHHHLIRTFTCGLKK